MEKSRDDKVEEDKFLQARIKDKIQLVEKKKKLESIGFLNLHQLEVVEKYFQKEKITNYFLFGGYEEAERKACILYPKEEEKQEVEEQAKELFQVIRICLSKKEEEPYLHRTYLGAVIKLGIKREKIGDILVDLSGADIIVEREIAEFLFQNLGSLERFSKANISKKAMEEIRKVTVKVEERQVVLSSMRLDTVVAELARCSRNKAVDLIQAERVLVNFQKETKKTKTIHTGDKITIRGKGRFSIQESLGITKSGRIILKIEKNV